MQHDGDIGNYRSLVTVCPVVPVQAEHLGHLVQRRYLVGWLYVTFDRSVANLLQLLQHSISRDLRPLLATRP